MLDNRNRDERDVIILGTTRKLHCNFMLKLLQPKIDIRSRILGRIGVYSGYFLGK